MSPTPRRLCYAALLLMVGPGCFLGSGASIPEGQARWVKLVNCTKVSGVGEPPTGRVWEIYAKPPNGIFAPVGTLNPDDPGVECEGSKAPSLTVEILDPPGSWEIRAYKVHREGFEADCYPGPPPIPEGSPSTVCFSSPFFYQTNINGDTARINLTEPGG
jgi:hypothetical protein